MTKTLCGCCLKPGQFPDPNDLKPPDPDCPFCDGTGELKRTKPKDERRPANTVAELIAILQTMPPEAKVFGFWESQYKEICDVIPDQNGVILLDVDDGWLREAIELQKRNSLKGE